MPTGIYSHRSRPAEERFWEKVNKNGPLPAQRPELGPCWLWLAGRTAKGYGRFNRSGRAHRFAYELLIGKFPTGKVPDHLCRVRHCVNPYHLEPVTSLENCLRGEGTWAIHRGNCCSRGHVLEGDNLGRHLVRGRYRRECRTCRKVWLNAAYRRRSKTERPRRCTN